MERNKKRRVTVEFVVDKGRGQVVVECIEGVEHAAVESADGRTLSRAVHQNLPFSSCQVIQRFRHGGYNTLVATCVGEEGLDIGEVDLIVCFDAHASPIRLVQRMGRTGRKRDGRIVILVTEGKEEQVRDKETICRQTGDIYVEIKTPLYFQ